MTIKKLAIGISMALILTATNAEAKPHHWGWTDFRVQQFCGDKYCGYYSKPAKRVKIVYKKRYKSTKAAIYRAKVKKPIKVASIGKEPITEHSTGLLTIARSHLGTNPTGWAKLWCARYIAQIAPGAAAVLKSKGLNPNWARDYALLPGARRNGKIGDIVVLTRGRAGHIGVVSGFDKNNNPIVISGNHIGRHGHRSVGEGTYSKSRVLAYASI